MYSKKSLTLTPSITFLTYSCFIIVLFFDKHANSFDFYGMWITIGMLPCSLTSKIDRQFFLTLHCQIQTNHCFWTICFRSKSKRVFARAHKECWPRAPLQTILTWCKARDRTNQVGVSTPRHEFPHQLNWKHPLAVPFGSTSCPLRSTDGSSHTFLCFVSRDGALSYSTYEQVFSAYAKDFSLYARTDT